MPTLPKKSIDWAETTGIVLGLVAAAALAIFLGALIIYWILGAIGLGQLTYWQIVGLLAIWELIKPRGDSK